MAHPDQIKLKEELEKLRKLLRTKPYWIEEDLMKVMKLPRWRVRHLVDVSGVWRGVKDGKKIYYIVKQEAEG